MPPRIHNLLVSSYNLLLGGLLQLYIKLWDQKEIRKDSHKDLDYKRDSAYGYEGAEVWRHAAYHSIGQTITLTVPLVDGFNACYFLLVSGALYKVDLWKLLNSMYYSKKPDGITVVLCCLIAHIVVASYRQTT